MLMMLVIQRFSSANLAQLMLMMLATRGFLAQAWQLMLMMLALRVSLLKLGAADAHDAGPAGFLCSSLRWLMLMMLARQGFLARTLGS